MQSIHNDYTSGPGEGERERDVASNGREVLPVLLSREVGLPATSGVSLFSSGDPVPPGDPGGLWLGDRSTALKGAGPLGAANPVSMRMCGTAKKKKPSEELDTARHATSYLLLRALLSFDDIEGTLVDSAP